MARAVTIEGVVMDGVNLGSLEGAGSNYSKGLVWFIVHSQGISLQSTLKLLYALSTSRGSRLFSC